MRETDLSEPVRLWIVEQGYTAYAEVHYLGVRFDWVGVRAEELVVIEMKQSLARSVLAQGLVGGLVAERVWAAISTNPRSGGVAAAREHGIGILQVDGGKVRVLLEAGRSKYWSAESGTRMRKRLEASDPGGTAGWASQRGEGPALDCLQRVRLYRKGHGKASWAEVYRDVDNHYANARSMAASLAWAAVRERKRLAGLPVPGSKA
jgi:hypothetical protein